MQVVINFQAVPRYPVLRVHAGAASPHTSSADVSQLVAAVAGEPFVLRIIPKDVYG